MREGSRAMMPANRIREIPLPIPFSSMRSPSQTTSMAPAENASTMAMPEIQPAAPLVYFTALNWLLRSRV